MILRWIRTETNKGLRFDCHSSTQAIKYGISQNISKEELAERKCMLKEIATTSIWSIDLVLLLHKVLQSPLNLHDHQLSILFCSTNFGVDESYSNFSYYKSAFDRDKRRVRNRFQLAKQLKIPMFSIPPCSQNNIRDRIMNTDSRVGCGLSLEYVINLVAMKDCVAIALIDNTILLHPSLFLQQQQKKKSFHKSDTDDFENIDNIYNSTNKIDMSYSGHYIILIGISKHADDIERAVSNQNQDQNQSQTSDSVTANEENYPPYCLVIKNPGIDQAVDFIAPHHFELAWRAEGTDQDIIFLRKC